MVKKTLSNKIIANYGCHFKKCNCNLYLNNGAVYQKYTYIIQFYIKKTL